MFNNFPYFEMEFFLFGNIKYKQNTFSSEIEDLWKWNLGSRYGIYLTLKQNLIYETEFWKILKNGICFSLEIYISNCGWYIGLVAVGGGVINI